MRYGVIGIGNMANAILKGMAESGNFKGDELIGFNRSEGKTLAAQRAFGLSSASCAKDVAARCDVLLLGVKPQNLSQVLPEIAPRCAAERLWQPSQPEKIWRFMLRSCRKERPSCA